MNDNNKKYEMYLHPDTRRAGFCVARDEARRTGSPSASFRRWRIGSRKASFGSGGRVRRKRSGRQPAGSGGDASLSGDTRLRAAAAKAAGEGGESSHSSSSSPSSGRVGVWAVGEMTTGLVLPSGRGVFATGSPDASPAEMGEGGLSP